MIIRVPHPLASHISTSKLCCSASATMVGAAGSGTCLHQRSQSNTEQDHRVDRIGDICPCAPENTAAECPYHTLPAVISEHSFFAEAFVQYDDTRQYEYPPPDSVFDRQTTPYRALNTASATHKTTGCQDSVIADVDASSDVAPESDVSFTTQHLATPCANARDDSGFGSSFDSSPLVSTPCGVQYTAAQGSIGALQSLQGTKSLTEPTHNPFQDDSSPYVAGSTIGRQRELEHRTDTLASIVDLGSFICDQCSKTCKDKPSLNHHKVTHDESKTHRHRCTQCQLGFRYPKDLRRHTNTVHGVRTYLCNDCNKVYKRRDHLDRHLKTRGHIALSETASTPNTDWQDVPFPTGSDSHQYSHDEYLRPSREHFQTPTPHRGLGIAHVHSNFQNTHLLPPHQGISRPSQNPISNSSNDDGATVSDMDSFWSEQQ